MFQPLLPMLFSLSMLARPMMGMAPNQPMAEKLRPTPAIQAMTPRILQALRKASLPFNRHNPDFSSLDGMFRKARFFGIGQETHGSKEIFQAQADLFAYLVEKHGVRTLLFEDSYGAVAPANDFLSGKGQDISSLAAALMTPWRTKEIGDLLRWMRAWNLAHPKDPVEIVGLDGQWGLERTIADVVAILPQEERPAWDREIQMIRAATVTASTVLAMDLDEKIVALAGADRLCRRVEKLACERKQEDWVAPLLAIRSLVGALRLDIGEQYADHGNVGKAFPVVASGTLNDLTRDAAMALNALTLLRTMPARKFAFFAHSEHVAKDTNVGSYLSMGSLLARSFNDPDYPEDRVPLGTLCTVSFGTRRGSVLAKSESERRVAAKAGARAQYRTQPLPQAIPNSLEGLLGRVGKGKDLLVNMHLTRGWLDQPLPIYSTGASMATSNESDNSVDVSYNYYSVAPAKVFDAYVLLDRTSASTILTQF